MEVSRCAGFFPQFIFLTPIGVDQISCFFNFVRDTDTLLQAFRVEIRFNNAGIIKACHGKNNAQVHIGKGTLNGIPTLENSNVRFEQRGQLCISLC